MLNRITKVLEQGHLKSKKDQVIMFWGLLLATFVCSHLCYAYVSGRWGKSKIRLINEIEQSKQAGGTALINNCFADVKDSIAQGDAPGKTDLISFVNQIEEKGFEIRSAATAGGDAVVRPLFVTAQAEFERAMAFHFAKGDIVHLVGMIHTPTPATPLCTEGEISDGLVDTNFDGDAKRLYTVQTRPAILRDYLSKGALLAAVYPQGGREKRSPQQLEIFDKVKNKYPHGLIDHTLEEKVLHHDMIGALYIFKTKEGALGAFAIKAFQANAPEDEKTWGIWFGLLTHPAVYQRAEAVLQYVYEMGGPDLTEYLFAH